MMRDWEIDQMHREEAKYEKECDTRHQEIFDELDHIRKYNREKLSESEWEGLESFVRDYEVKPETNLDDIATEYTEMLSDRYNFIIYR